MKRFLTPLLVAAVLLCAVHGQTDDAVSARNAALELAGAFGNDGFKLREGYEAATLASGKPILLQVNLYAGNEYWFSAAAVGGVKKISVAIFDEAGKAIEADLFGEGARAAAGFSPGLSGSYYIQVAALEGDSGTCALVYSYK